MASYTYDANGNRISQTESGATTNFYLSEAGQTIEERQGSTVTAQNLWGGTYVNNLIQRTEGTTVYYVQEDANSNTTAVTDASGHIQERYTYLPFGTVMVHNADGTVKGDGGIDASVLSEPFLFQGGRLDAATGENHFESRDEISGTGTWAERDPSGYTDSLNFFEAFLNNPIRFTDASGLKSTTTGPTTNPSATVDLDLSPANADQVSSVKWSDKELPKDGANPELGLNDLIDSDFTISKTTDASGVCTFHAKLTAHFWLELDIQGIKTVIEMQQFNGGNTTIDGVYGHEQRHMLNEIALYTRVAAGLGKDLDNLNAKKLSGDAAQAQSLQIKLKWLKELIAGRTADANHELPEPKAGTPYPPIGQMPKDPSPMPTTQPTTQP